MHRAGSVYLSDNRAGICAVSRTQAKRISCETARMYYSVCDEGYSMKSTAYCTDCIAIDTVKGNKVKPSRRGAHLPDD